MYFVIWNHISNEYLSRISVGATPFLSPTGWISSVKRAIYFSSEAEAQNTIDFICKVFYPSWTDAFEIQKVGDPYDG